MSSEAVDRAEYEQDAVARAKILGGRLPFIKGYTGKFWSASEEERRGAKPIKEDAWFRMYQPLLLEMANTDEGRELLHIPAEYGKIEWFHKNSVFWKTGAIWIDDDGLIREEWTASFRIGAMWANAIRYNWTKFCKLAKTFYEREYEGMKIYRPVLRVEGELVAAHAVETAYPDPDTETTTVDGYTKKYTSTSWDTTHDAAESDDDAERSFMHDEPYLFVQNAVNHAPATGGDGRYSITRTHLLFDTSALGAAGATTGDITAGSGTDVRVQTYSNLSGRTQCQDSGVWGTPSDHTESSYGYTAPCEQDDLASNTSIVKEDYGEVGSNAEHCAAGDRILQADMDAQYYWAIWELNAAGIADVNVSGVTGIMLREGHDIQDVAMINSQWGHASTGVNFHNGAYYRSSEYSEDNTASPDVGPRLTITYAISDIQAVNGIALASIRAVNGITAANGEKINGIDF